MDFFELYIESLYTILANLTGGFTEAYITRSTIFSVIVGVICGTLLIVSACLIKKHRVFGIVAGVFQIVGPVALQKGVHVYSKLEVFKEITGGSTEIVEEKLAEYFSGQFSLLGIFVLCQMIFMASTILTFIYIIMSIKHTPKLCSVAALIFHIFRYMFVSPLDTFTAAVKQVTDATQTRVDLLNYAATLLPILLLFIGAFFAGKIAAKKALKEQEKMKEQAEAIVAAQNASKAEEQTEQA